jgi:hypothetical protein
MIAKKRSPPQPPTLLMTAQKKIAIELFFIVNVINDCDNNSRVVERR